MQGRIYGEKTEIDPKNVRKFYDDRAQQIHEKGWGAVSLNDETKNNGKDGYDYDEKIVLPQLQLKENDRVLELGCGMGRLASIVLPYCKFYHGIDFSEKMILAAEDICKKFSGRFKFEQATVVNAVGEGETHFDGQFDCVILAGVCMYLNDDELERTFLALPKLCKEHCTIYIRVTAAYEQRLTLKQFASKDLQANYDAIYRTPQEYEKLLAPLYDDGFSIVESGFLEGSNRKETEKYSWLLRR